MKPRASESIQLVRRRLAEIRAADDLPQRKNALRVDGQLVDAHAEEGLGQSLVSTELAADADPDAVSVSGVDGRLDGAEDCRMVGIQERLQLRVLTVDRQSVLGQVVGSDSARIAFAFFSSQTEMTIGNMMARWPKADARSRARSCVLKKSFLVRQMRSARRPRAGLSS